MRTMLRAYTEANEEDWDTLLPLVEFAVNTSPSKSTGFSPFYLHFGRHPILPADVYYGTAFRPNLSKKEYIHKLEEKRQRVFDLVGKFKEELGKRMKDAYDEKHKATMRKLIVGDTVCLRNEARTGELVQKLNKIYKRQLYKIKKTWETVLTELKVKRTPVRPQSEILRAEEETKSIFVEMKLNKSKWIIMTKMNSKN